jgi:hypothetical protein
MILKETLKKHNVKIGTKSRPVQTLMSTVINRLDSVKHGDAENQLAVSRLSDMNEACLAADTHEAMSVSILF